MSTNIQRHDFEPSPPALDEGYWSSLLNEDEELKPAHSTPDADPPVGSETQKGDITRRPADESGGIAPDWQTIQRLAENDEVIEMSVAGFNRGGLLVEWRSLRGFVPASQLISFPATANNTLRRSALAERMDHKLKLRVIELSMEKNRLILSERAALAEPGERADIIARLKPGDVIGGTVTNLCEFGAFIDLGGLEGLAHISELSWGRVGHPSQILQRGQYTDVYVLSVDPANARIALSLKRLRPDPWKTAGDRYHVGEVIEGEITNVVDFGAFACIEEGLEGLIHVSELAEGHFLHPRNVVTEGQVIRARILSIDGEARRLGLTLRLT